MNRLLLSTVLLLAIGCLEAPINSNPILELNNSIEGDIVFGGPDEVEVGPTFITIYDAGNPGPPVGLGGPLTFSSVPAASYADSAGGLRAASFGVSGLEDGQYIVNGLMDLDGDFNPFSSVLAGATCGDWVGTHLDNLDLNNPQTAVVPVEGGELRSGVTVLVAQQVPTERPAFEFVVDDPEPTNPDNIPPGPIVDLQAAESPVTPQLFRLRASSIDTGFGPEAPLSLGPACQPLGAPECGAAPFCACNPETFSPKSDLFNPCATALYLLMSDSNQDGIVDANPDPMLAQFGVLDIWPRVFVEANPIEPLGTFQFEGETLPERWVAQAFPLYAEIGAAALQGLGPDALAPVGVPVPLNELSFTFAPVFRHYHGAGNDGVDPNNGPYDDVVLVDFVDNATGTPDPLDANPDDPVDEPIINPGDDDSDQIPPGGPWTVTVVSFTGQTWEVPNDIGRARLPGPPPFSWVPQAISLTLSVPTE